MEEPSMAGEPLLYIFLLFCGYGLTRSFTPWVIRLSKYWGFIDVPDERRVHTSPTPRAGGVAIFLGFHLTLAILFVFPWNISIGMIDATWWYGFLISSAFLLFVGLIDDLRGLSPFVKLAGQLVAAYLMFINGVRFGGVFGVAFPMWLDVLATLFWFAFIVNAFNLIDGYDGLASGLAAIAALGIGGTFVFRHLVPETLFIIAFIGCCFGFLRYNLHPARIFLGDCGSMLIGFTLAGITLTTMSKGTALAAVGVPLLAIGVPLYDTVLAVWRRLGRHVFTKLVDGARSGGIMSADTEHLHHRLADYGVNARNVSATLYLANALLVLVGLMSLLYSNFAIGLYVAAFCVVMYVTVRHVARLELWQSGLVIVYGLGDRVKPLSAFCTYAVLDLLGLGAAFLGTVWLLYPYESFECRSCFTWYV